MTKATLKCNFCTHVVVAKGKRSAENFMENHLIESHLVPYQTILNFNKRIEKQQMFLETQKKQAWTEEKS